jgi:RNA polymerase sigma factor for flagellar operon FliA
LTTPTHGASAGARALTTAERETLVEAHLAQVKYIADRLAAKLPPFVDRDDLVGAGVIGLLDAVDKYDPGRGVLFRTYAELRVRGAMLDSLRALDWVPRSLRRRARAVEQACQRIEQERGRAAHEEEVAGALGLTLREFHALLAELHGLSVTSLDGGEDEEGRARPRRIEDDPELIPLTQYEYAERRNRLAAAVERLPERERQVVALYYVEELTMKEIGAVLGVTESRVSQINTQAVLRLRAALPAGLAA